MINFFIVIVLLFNALHLSMGSDAEVLVDTKLQTAEFVPVDGGCRDAQYQRYDYVSYNIFGSDCATACGNFKFPNHGLVGYETAMHGELCHCLFTKGYLKDNYGNTKPDGSSGWQKDNSGAGTIAGTKPVLDFSCRKNKNFNPDPNHDDATVHTAASFVSVGGKCIDASNRFYNWVGYNAADIDECKSVCGKHHNQGLVGLEFGEGASTCACLYSAGYLPDSPDGAVSGRKRMTGSGSVKGKHTGSERQSSKTCLRNTDYSYSEPPKFKLLPQDKELLGRVKGLLRGMGDSVGRDQGEGTEAAGPDSIVV